MWSISLLEKLRINYFQRSSSKEKKNPRIFKSMMLYNFFPVYPHHCHTDKSQAYIFTKYLFFT